MPYHERTLPSVRDRHEQQLLLTLFVNLLLRCVIAFALAFSLTWQMHKLFGLDCSFGGQRFGTWPKKGTRVFRQGVVVGRWGSKGTHSGGCLPLPSLHARLVRLLALLESKP